MLSLDDVFAIVEHDQEMFRVQRVREIIERSARGQCEPKRGRGGNPHWHLENIEGTVPERSRNALDNELAPIREQSAAAELDEGRASLSLLIFRSWRLIHIGSAAAACHRAA
jgi:hypothetical protein